MLSGLVIIFTALMLTEFGPASALARRGRRGIPALILRLFSGAALVAGGLGQLDMLVLLLVACAQLCVATSIWVNSKGRHLLSPLWQVVLIMGLISGVSLIGAVVRPDAFVSGFWVAGEGASWLGRLGLSPYRYVSILVVISGGMLTIRVGAILIEAVFASAGYRKDLDAECLPGGGAIIGVLERGIIFFLVLIDQIMLIGFLVAAKSFLRLGTVRERRASEYVIIGTLSSFAWAVGVGWTTKTLLLHL